MSTEQLVAYALGELDAETSAGVDRRLSESPGLRETMALVRGVVARLDEDDTAAPRADVVERVVSLLPRRPAPASPAPNAAEWLGAAARVVAELVFDSRRRSPALAGFRGSRDSYQLTYASPLGTVELDVVPLTARDSDRWRIRGQLSDCDAPGGLAVLLTRPGENDETARSETNERGFFRLDTLPGAFDLHIAVMPRPLLLREVRVG